MNIFKWYSLIERLLTFFFFLANLNAELLWLSLSAHSDQVYSHFCIWKCFHEFLCHLCLKCMCTYLCVFRAAALWLTTGSSNQQDGVATTFPFPRWPRPPHLPPSTIEIPGSHYGLRGLRVNPIFQLSLSPFPLIDSFPEVTGSCHLNSHQFTRGKGVVSIGSPPPPPPSSPT